MITDTQTIISTLLSSTGEGIARSRYEIQQFDVTCTIPWTLELQSSQYQKTFKPGHEFNGQ